MELNHDTLPAPLNAAQREAVLIEHGPALVVAGAGTGKTRTLTHRAARLISHCGVPPRNVLAVTFTNRAAKEMRGRIRELLEGDTAAPAVGTFHRLGLTMLRKHAPLLGLPDDFIVYPRDAQEALLKDIAAEAGGPGRAAELISRAKGDLFSPDDCATGQDEDLRDIADVYSRYQERLRAAGAVDFDDLIMLPVLLMRNFPEAAQHWRDMYPHLLIDEYQDINPAQYALVRALAAPRNNVFAIGDADQAIYAFRGASVQSFLDFERDFPGAQVIRLEQNYRSSPVILEAALRVVEQNTQRVARNLFTECEPGPNVVICETPNEKAEAEWVVSEIEDMLGGASRFQHDSDRVEAAPAAEAAFSDIAVLYRLNAQAQPFVAAFDKWGLPCRVVGAQSFMSRRETRDVLAYWRLIEHPGDDVSARRVINTPARGVGDKAISALADYAAGKESSLLDVAARADYVSTLKPAQVKACRAFAALIQDLKNEIADMLATAALEHIMNRTGLDDLHGEDGARSPALTELLNFATQFDAAPDAAVSRAEFSEEAALMSELDAYDPRAQAVTLMTMHASKGLEFDHVFIAGAERGLLPYDPHADGGDVQEERRLLHVGMTRARTRLYISHAQSRFLFGNRTSAAPCPFLEHIPEHLVERRTVEKRIPKKRPEPPPQLELF